MANNPHDTLMALFAGVNAFVGDPSSAQSRNLRRLEDLRRRLATDRFQLAVLGQFKRGKTTLLNALLGISVLPMAVVPLTAIPTFVTAGDAPRIRAVFNSGVTEESKGKCAEELADRLALLVTEEGNPNNSLGLGRVEVSLAAPLLQGGVVLIDTPGVGSTYTHNTETAEAFLPECDAALFVISPDPPITEVEISYLKRVQATVVRLIIVLNKVDAVGSQDDLAAIIAFIRRTLAEKVGMDEAFPLFQVSARSALRAKITGDNNALASSGLPELEAYLIAFLARDKRAALEAAVGRKAAAILDDLLMETELRCQALRLPMEDLSRRIVTFDAAMSGFNDEHRIIRDILAGDRQRALKQIETDAEDLRRRARAALEAELDRALTKMTEVEAARNEVQTAVPCFFDVELGRAAASFDDSLTSILNGHKLRIDHLIEVVRQTAAAVMDVAFRTIESTETFEFRREPYWVSSGRAETLAPVAPGAFDWLLPKSVRRTRIRQRLLEEIDTIVRRNVENLRWATRQNVEDAFRHFSVALDEMLARSIEETRAVMIVARDQRLAHSDRVEAEMLAVERSLASLTEIRAALRDLA
jgi:GTPase SAR1 family protein